MKQLISIITPFFNEEDSIKDYFAKLEKILSEIDQIEVEFVAIDDGSTDNTFHILQQIATNKKNLQVIKLSRNFGKDIALTAGIEHASGDAAIPIDADLQDSPEIIVQMIEKWRQGFKVVLAERVSRKDPLFKKITAAIFYKLAPKIMNNSLPKNVGDFRLIDRVVIDQIKTMKEKSRFMRGIMSWVGFKTTSVKFERKSRQNGKTKYNFFSMIKYACDGIFSFSEFPIRIITYCGFSLSVGSFLYGIVIIFEKIFFNNLVPGYASIMCLVLFIGGLNFIFIGIIGEYVGRIFNEVKNRPLYIIEQKIDNQK